MNNCMSGSLVGGGQWLIDRKWARDNHWPQRTTFHQREEKTWWPRKRGWKLKCVTEDETWYRCVEYNAVWADEGVVTSEARQMRCVMMTMMMVVMMMRMNDSLNEENASGASICCLFFVENWVKRDQVKHGTVCGMIQVGCAQDVHSTARRAEEWEGCATIRWKIHRSGEGKGRRGAIGEIQSEGVDG